LPKTSTSNGGLPRRNDVLLTTEAPLGEVAMLRSDEKIALAQRIILLRAKPKLLDPRYLFYALQGGFAQGEMRARASGTTVLGIKQSELRQVRVPCPALPAQERIAGILTAYDDLIENCQRRIKILESMARALYREWFVNFRFPGHENQPRLASPLGEIPGGWEVKKLAEVCHLTMGQSPKSDFYNETGEGTPFHQGVTNFGERFPSDRLFCTAEGRLAEAGDILFSVRAPVGRMNIARNRIIIGRGLSAIRHNEGSQAFLWEQLRNRFTEEDMMGNGAIFAAVTKKDMEGIDLLWPPRSVVAAATSHYEPIHSEIAVLSGQIENLRRTRDLLLPRLLSGQIAVEAA
jgi:type I restriction enzyme S subunit